MLLTLVLVRCITEAPMRADGILSWSTFVHVLLLAMACHFVRASRSGGARSPGLEEAGACRAWAPGRSGVAFDAR